MKDIEREEKALREAEEQFGKDDPRLAPHLEKLAALLRSRKLRLLEAANMLARAEVLRQNHSEISIPHPIQRPIVPIEELRVECRKMNGVAETQLDSQSDEMKCPFCAELIKKEAVLCRFCRSRISRDGATNDVPKQQRNSTALAPKERIPAIIFPLSALALLAFVVWSSAAGADWTKSSSGALLLVIPLCIVLGIALYFVPTIISCCKKKKNTVAIVCLNLFLGWTFIGWLIALVWSLAED